MERNSRQQDTLLNLLGQSFSNVLNNNRNKHDPSLIDEGSRMNVDGVFNFLGGNDVKTSSGGGNFFNQVIKTVDESLDEESKRSILSSINSILGDNYHQDDIKNALEISKGLFGVKENTEIGNAIECMQRNIKDPNCLNFGHEEILTTILPTTEELLSTQRIETSQWSSAGNEFGVIIISYNLMVVYIITENNNLHHILIT